MNSFKLGFGTALLLALASAACSAPATDDVSSTEEQELRAPKIALRLARTDLVTEAKDPLLVNPWGIAFNPRGAPWISNAGTGTSTVYDAAGTNTLTVTVPNVEGATGPSSPTGQVFNGGTSFSGDRFIFVTEQGTVAGWQPANGVLTRNDRSSSGAVYKGLALAGDRLFATDFMNGKIDVFDNTYALVETVGFSDPSIPRGYAPFNVQALEGKLFVSYAMQDCYGTTAAHVSGRGRGFVNVFELDGTLSARIGSRGSLDAPWGLALAPASFGAIAGKLLVGNRGDGKISVFELPSVQAGAGSYGADLAVPAKFVGRIGDAAGDALAIDGLWALTVSPAGALAFAAGPEGGTKGAYGSLAVVAE